MKIMIQDRTMIVEQPRCVWAVQKEKPEEGWIVASNIRRAPVLGTYATKDRAISVLAEIFEFQRAGRCNYYLPVE